jgi:predicted DNA binding CopG/RHH family protein
MNSSRDLIMKRHIHIMNQQLDEFDNTPSIEELKNQTINEEEKKRLFEKNHQDYLEYNRQWDLENKLKKLKIK